MKSFRHGLVLAAYPLVFWASFLVANHFWHPPAGVRFATFLLLPWRWWLPLMLASELIGRWLDPVEWAQSFRGWAWWTAFFIATSLGPWLLRRQGFRGIEGPASGAWLLGAMLASALAESLTNVAWPFRDATGIADTADISRGILFLHLTLGDYLGMLMVVPLALLMTKGRPLAPHWRRWRIDVPMILLPSLLAAATMLAGAAGHQIYFFVAGLCLIPATYMAFRTGWRGAALAVTGISVTLAAQGWLNGSVPATLESQLFIAAAGSALFMLGIAIEALRNSQHALHSQNCLLEAERRRLDELAAQLRDTAKRNLTMSEDLRRWITAELHDELGQNLTALQLRIKLAERDAAPDTFESAKEIIAGMRRTVSDLLAGLRPAGLDDLGLVSALRQGSIRHMVEAAGLQYGIRIDARGVAVASLDDDAQTTLYRLVQEAATNTVRHAQARRFDVALRLCASSSCIRVVLVCRDDGNGGVDVAHSGRPGLGLRSMGDRVLSFGGRLRIRSDASGTRLAVAIDFPVATGAG